MAQTKPKAAQFYGVSGNGTAGQVLISDGNGGMSWGSNTEQFTVSWATPTGQSLTYTQPSPQASSGISGTTFPTTTFTATKSGEEISGTATIAGLPTGITATQSLSGSGADNILTVTLAGVFPGADSLNTALTISGLTLAPPLTVDYLVVAGGGGGGGGTYNGAGGGAGGLLTNYSGTALTLTAGTSYLTTIGSGGANGTTTGVNGSNSVFNNIISIGGGGGGQHDAPRNGLDGGSGGGGSQGPSVGGDGTNIANGDATNQGNNGGGTWYAAAAGGGGAGAAGLTGPGTSPYNGGVAGVSGGVGLQNAITVTSGTGPYYAGGGGGGGRQAYSVPQGVGGSGGGGNGGPATGGNGADGTPNTGGGGGGVGSNADNSTIRTGGAGGSGIVILRYPNVYTITAPAGLIATTDSTTVVNTKITTFTSGTGNIQFNL